MNVFSFTRLFLGMLGLHTTETGSNEVMAWCRGKGRYGTVGNMDHGSSPAGFFLFFFAFFFRFFKVCANKPRARSASREGKARAASVQRELRGQSPSCEHVVRSASCERAAQAARAKPEHTS